MDDRTTYHKFILLCHGRTGSTLLGSLLDSHPGIFWAGEYYKRVRFWRGFRSLLRPLIWRCPSYYLSCLATIHGNHVFGCKLMPHYAKEIGHTVAELHRHGWLVVYLQRRNFFLGSLSHIVARQTHHWLTRQNNQTLPSTPVLKIEPQVLLDNIREYQKLYLLEQRVLLNIPYVSITYEDDLADSDRWNETTGRIFRALGLPSLPVQSRFEKTWDRPYSEIVSNYHELIEAVRNSEWGAFASIDDKL